MLKKIFSKTHFITFLLIIINLIVFSHNAMAQHSWNKTRSEAGVNVYERESAHRLNDIKTVFKLNADMNSAISFLLDAEAFKKMVSNIKKARLIEKVSETERYYYLNITVDNIINRDAVVKVAFSQNSRSGIVTCTMELNNSINYDIEHESIMPFKAHWYLKPKRNGQVKVTLIYSGEIDEYNDLVYTLVEELMKSQLFQVSKSMKTEVNTLKYENAEPNLFR